MTNDVLYSLLYAGNVLCTAVYTVRRGTPLCPLKPSVCLIEQTFSVFKISKCSEATANQLFPGVDLPPPQKSCCITCSCNYN